MRIFRFDDEVSIPISQFGSRFKIGPLTGLDSRVRVQAMHLPPGGCIGRHETTVQQLLVVVVGTGWVAGADRARYDIVPGYAALWEVGEDHESGTDAGMTAIGIEGTFEVLARTTKAEPIVVVDHDPEWPTTFASLRDRLWPAIADVALRVEHVGSTSVPGLAAKPVIDIDIVIASEAAFRPVIEQLATVGYRWRGNLGIPGRETFFLRDDQPAHHLYVVVDGSTPYLDHVLLRDLLRDDADARSRYGERKKQMAFECDGDIDVYGGGKHELITELLSRARADRNLS